MPVLVTGGETEAQTGKVAFPADRGWVGGWGFTSTSLLKYKEFMLPCKSAPVSFLKSLWIHAALSF